MLWLHYYNNSYLIQFDQGGWTVKSVSFQVPSLSTNSCVEPKWRATTVSPLLGPDTSFTTMGNVDLLGICGFSSLKFSICIVVLLDVKLLLVWSTATRLFQVKVVYKSNKKELLLHKIIELCSTSWNTLHVQIELTRMFCCPMHRNWVRWFFPGKDLLWRNISDKGNLYWHAYSAAFLSGRWKWCVWCEQEINLSLATSSMLSSLV